MKSDPGGAAGRPRYPPSSRRGHRSLRGMPGGMHLHRVLAKMRSRTKHLIPGPGPRSRLPERSDQGSSVGVISALPGLQTLGWDDGWASALAELADPTLTPGRVSRIDRGVCTLMTGLAEIRVSSHPGYGNGGRRLGGCGP